MQALYSDILVCAGFDTTNCFSTVCDSSYVAWCTVWLAVKPVGQGCQYIVGYFPSTWSMDTGRPEDIWDLKQNNLQKPTISMEMLEMVRALVARQPLQYQNFVFESDQVCSKWGSKIYKIQHLGRYSLHMLKGWPIIHSSSPYPWNARDDRVNRYWCVGSFSPGMMPDLVQSIHNCMSFTPFFDWH